MGSKVVESVKVGLDLAGGMWGEFNVHEGNWLLVGLNCRLRWC